MTRKQLSGRFALYRGYCLEFQSWDNTGQVLLSTTDPNSAKVLGFSEGKDGYYRGWVPRSDLQELYWQGVYGEVNGVKVLIDSEHSSSYLVRAQRALEGLARVDKHLWEGSIAKSAFTRTWIERKPAALP